MRAARGFAAGAALLLAGGAGLGGAARLAAGTADGTGDISVTPTSLSLGPVLADSLAVDSLVVRNIGTGILTIGQILVDDPAFDIGSQSPGIPPGTTLDPGTQRQLEVAFRGILPGITTATLTIPSDDPDQPEVLVSLQGEVTGPPIVTVSPDSLNEVLDVDSTRTRALTIGNLGQSDLHWALAIVPAAGPGPGRGLDGVRILWDRTHGQTGTTAWTTIVDSLQARGAIVDEITGAAGSLTPQLLGGYRIFWSVDVNASWTAAERAALATWTTNGGGVLLVGDNLASIGKFNELLTDLGSGIRYATGGGTSETVTQDIRAHPTTQGVSRIYLGLGVRTLATVDAPADTLYADPAGPPVAAAEEIGVGRIVALTDEAFDDVAIQLAQTLVADNLAFGLQSVEWLGGSTWLAADSTSGTVAPADSQVVQLRFDSTGLNGGEFDLNVRLLSNDPVTPVVDVPVHLLLTGAPDIALPVTSVAFGPVPVGDLLTKAFTVRNLGLQVLNVSGIQSSAGAFGASPTVFSVPAQDSAQVTLFFQPDSVGHFSGALSIQSDDPDEPSVDVLVAGDGRVNCQAPCPAPRVLPADVQGSPGFLFWLDVTMEGNPVSVSSFGFTLEYDGTLLQFADSAMAGALTSGFFDVSAQENEPGRLTGGGFGLTPVPAGSSGSIARLLFRVLCDTCAIGTTSDLILADFTDDIAGMRPCCGAFTLAACPTGDGDVNTDLSLTPQDALCALKIFLNGQVLPPDPDCAGNGDCETSSADANCDGQVTPGDALDIYGAWQSGIPPTTCLGQGRARAGSVRWGVPTAAGDGRVVFPLVVSGAAPAAFGLDVRYDPARWAWSGLERGEAGAGWTFLDAVPSGDGVVRIGGVDAGRGVPAGVLARLGFVPVGGGPGGTTGGDARLRVEAVLDAGFEGPREVAPGGRAGGAGADGIERVGPVPAAAGLVIVYGVSRDGARVELTVHDVTGRLVRTLAAGPSPAGRHERAWDGRDEAGQRVGAGVYFLTLRIDARLWTRRAVLLR